MLFLFPGFENVGNMLASVYALCYHVLVNVISKPGLMKLAKKHPSEAAELVLWYRRARRGRWVWFGDVRADFPSADQIGEVLVFDIGWNSLRLICTVDYPTARVFVKALLTHKEYDRKEWMKWTRH